MLNSNLYLDTLHKYNEIDYIIMEKQPKQFRKNHELEIILLTYLATRFTINQSVQRFSPITVKNHVGVPCSRNHDQNKVNMVNFVKENKEIFLGGENYPDHIADCIAMLDLFLSKHKKISHFVKNFEQI